MANEISVTWDELLAYFRDSRELAITEMTLATTDRQLWAAQGKLALVEELLTLPDIFATMASQKEESAKEAPKAVPIRQRATQVLGAANAERLYGKDKGALAEGG